MPIQKIPLEIIIKIIELIDRIELHKYLYLCKEWYPVVKCIYFRYIYLGRKKIPHLKEKLSTMDNNDQCFQLFPMTRQLYIGDDYDGSSDKVDNKYTSYSTLFTEREFLFLLSRFNNLERLILKNSVHKESYVRILCNCREIKQLPSLKELSLEKDYFHPRHYESPSLIFTTFYQFRDSMSHISIKYSKNLDNESSFMKSLADFKKLEKLEICNYRDPSLTMFDLLQACPRLSHFVYNSDFPVPVNAVQKLTDILQKDQRTTISDFFRNLKIAELSTPKPAAPYADFFANYSRGSLNDVEVNLTDFGMSQWMSTIEAPLILIYAKVYENTTLQD